MGNIIKFLWGYSSRIKYLILAVALLAGISRDLVMMVINWSVSAINSDDWLTFWLPAFLFVLVLFLISGFAYRVLSQVLVTELIRSIRLQMANDTLNVLPSFLKQRTHGALYQIMTEDVKAVSIFSRSLLEILPALIFLAIAIPQLFWLSPLAGICAVAVMAGGATAYYIQQKAILEGMTDLRALEIDYFNRVSDIINGFRELRLHSRRRKDLYDHVDAIVTKYRATQIFVEKRYALGDASVQFLKFALFGAIIFAVPYFFARDPTFAFQLLTIVLFSLAPFEQIVAKYPQYMGTVVAYLRVDELIQALKPYQRPQQIEQPAPLSFERIEFRQIVAVYEGPETSDFQFGPVDVALNRGEVVQVVGGNGSGKTTFFNLLCGLMRPVSGEILVDGKPLDYDEMENYRALFSAVFIDYHLFHILYGLYDVREEERDSMLDKLGLGGITEIDNIRFTRLDLSAGQRRRLALAVALLENRQIVILDEFIADQDPERRRFFFEELVPQLKAEGKTVLIATHDLSWERTCDKLIRFDDGRIVDLQAHGDAAKTDRAPADGRELQRTAS